MNEIYLDNNATTRVASEVLDAMMPFLEGRYGNPSSMHTFGGLVHKDIENAREQVAALINAEPGEIFFTSCGTESDNTAIMNAVDRRPWKRHIITTRVEHPAVLNFCQHLARKGFRITYVPVDSLGRLDMEGLTGALDEDTVAVSVMLANNETGVIFPIKEVLAHLKGSDLLVHTDAVQAAGKIAIDVKDIAVDMLTLSGHKLHAPKGIGALFVRRGTSFYPYIIGGHQEGGRRAGTENVASIIGFGKAAELARLRVASEAINVMRLRDRLEQGILMTCPDSRVNGDTGNRLPNTTNVSFSYIEGEAILLRLNEHGVCASSGSACTSGSLEPSHVLRAMGVPPTAIHGSVRFSLSRFTTEREIDEVLRIMPGIVRELRHLSPFGRT